MEQSATSYQSQGLARALMTLKHLGAAEKPLTLAELSDALDLPKSTLLRLLAVLEEQDFVYREGAIPTYGIGHAVLEISESYRKQVDLTTMISPYLRKLASRTGLTANVGVLEGRSMLHLCVEEPDRALRYRSSAGSLDQTYCTGLGKLLLSRLPAERVTDHVPAEPFEAFTPHTITSTAQLEADLESIRQRGYSTDDQERDIGVVCLAIAIPLEGTNIALSVSGPAGELTETSRSSIAGVLRQVAAEIGADRRFAAALVASVPAAVAVEGAYV